MHRAASSVIAGSGRRRRINLALIGPPGSGKGTYGGLLAQGLNATFLSAGDLLREQVAGQTALGRKVAERQRSGALVSDHLVAEVVLGSLRDGRSGGGKAVDGCDDDGVVAGFVIDGFPRTVRQAELITPSRLSIEMASQMGHPWPEHLRVHFAVSIDLPDSICVEKIMGRRKCRSCGKDFNVADIDGGGFVMPPILPDPPCPCDGDVEWESRDDDTGEVVARRLRDFHAETAPVANYYEEQGKLLRFVPYLGVDSMPVLEQMVRQKLDEM